MLDPGYSGGTAAEQIQSEEFAITAGAFATVNHGYDELCAAWSFAKLDQLEEKLFAACAQEAERRMDLLDEKLLRHRPERCSSNCASSVCRPLPTQSGRL